MAEIYLKHKRNKKMYINCFEQMVRENPDDLQCQLLLGDSYMNIQCCQKAILCYEQALMMSDDDEKIAYKLGQALLASHDYQRAQLHFESTLANSRNADCTEIKAELAELYLQFEEYDKVSISKMSIFFSLIQITGAFYPDVVI